MPEIVVMNLDRSTDRWAGFERRNHAHVKFTRFSAFEGRNLSRQQLEADGLLMADVPYTPGAAGCAASHIALWKKAVAEGRPLTICEDDAIFNAAFTVRTEELFSRLKDSYDLVLWGWNFDSVMSYQLLPGVSICAARFDQAALQGALDHFQQLNFGPSLFRLVRAFGLPSYTVSPQGAATLLKMCLPLRSMSVRFPGYKHLFPNNGIDIVTSAVYPAIRAFVSLPPLVVTPNVHASSTIQTVNTGLDDLVNITI